METIPVLLCPSMLIVAILPVRSGEPAHFNTACQNVPIPPSFAEIRWRSREIQLSCFCIYLMRNIAGTIDVIPDRYGESLLG